MKLIKLIPAFFLTAMLFIACNNENQTLDEQTLTVSLEAPEYFDNTLNNFIPFIPGLNVNGIENANQVAHLGRILFYDKSLSAGSSVACGSCHLQEFAFADPFKHSVGIGSQLSQRNTPTIINTSFGAGLFWDQSATNLSDLVTKPIGNHREMGFSNMGALVQKLSTKEYYPPLFNSAFGHSTVTAEGLAQALTLFCSSLNSFDSDVDRFSIGESQLTAIQQHGMHLFEEKQCNSCHGILNNGSLDIRIANDISGNANSFGYTGASLQGDVANIGLNVKYSDKGVGALTGNAFQDGQFKIPTLRNITLTAPYMHDGRFATLHEVLDFYSNNIQAHHNLDDRLKDSDGNPLNIDLTETDKSAIIAFLGGLTSHDLLDNDLFSDPFE